MPEPINPVRLNDRGPEVRNLHAALRALGFLEKPLDEMSAASFGVGTRDALLAFQRARGIPETGLVDDATQAELAKALKTAKAKSCVVGRITGAAGSEISLRLHAISFHQKRPITEKIKGGKDGYYALEYDAPATKKPGRTASAPLAVELDIEYVAGRSKKKTILPVVRYNVSDYEIINYSLPAPAQTPKSEYGRILDALQPHIGEASKLGDLKEDEKQKDFTFLANSTGLNVRDIVFASQAARMSKTIGAEPQCFYALVKSGFSLDERSLALADQDMVEETIKKAVAAGIVRLVGSVDGEVNKLKEFARKTRPTLKAGGALSSYQELLDLGGLTKTEEDAFFEIFFSHRGPAAGMWKEVKDKFIEIAGGAKTGEKSDAGAWKSAGDLLKAAKAAKRGEETVKAVDKKIERLKLQGKLSFLTSGSAPLIKRLMAKIKTRNGVADLSSLADQGYDKPETWEALVRDELKNGSGKKSRKLADLIPTAYAGKTDGERLAAYAEDMAKMVKNSFPLQAVRRKIKDGELTLPLAADKAENTEIVKHVCAFLDKADQDGRRFELGETALGRFIKENRKELFNEPMDGNLKEKLILKEKENLKNRNARSFILKNREKAFLGVRTAEKTGKPSSAVLLPALKSRDVNGLTLSVFLKKTIPDDCFKKTVGPDTAKILEKNVRGLMAEEEKLLPKKIENKFRRNVIEAVKRLVRLYQVSPNDDAFQALLNTGIKSAYGIASFSVEDFCDLYSDEASRLKTYKQNKIPEQEIRKTAELIHRKAMLIHATAINVAAAAGQVAGSSVEKISGARFDEAEIGVAPEIVERERTSRAITRPLSIAPRLRFNRQAAAMRDLIRQYPAMEQLFGSIDYCECRECQSIIGPAAYLVDLFRFLEHADPNPYDRINESWQAFITKWKTTHHTRYPFMNQEEFNRWRSEHPFQGPFLEMTPYQILLKHRPDLPHLPLTCENTNTLVPYIDLVNEILEFYITNPHAADETEEDLIDDFVRYDTGEATSAELVAEPQNILPAAYDKLRNDSCYPLILPFDLWLETVRLFFDHFETPLWKVLEAFRTVDELELYPPPGGVSGGTPYYRYQIFLEYLGISPAEYQLFTDKPQSTELKTEIRDKWWYELYGYPHGSADSSANVIDELKSAKTLSRRLGVTYKELAEIVKTHFVNPGLEELGIVWKLGIEIADVIGHFKGTLTTEQEALFSAKLDEIQAKYQSYFTGRGTTPLDVLDGLWQAGKFRETLVLRDWPESSDANVAVLSDFDNTYLEYAGGENGMEITAAVSDFIRINFFVRLWRKLSWSIEETDWALKALWPANIKIKMGATTAPEENISRWTDLAEGFTAALLYLSHCEFLEEELKPGRGGRQKLFALWADMPTTGKKSLYSQLFLGPALVKNDTDAVQVFDDPFGQYLQHVDPIPHLSEYLTTVQGALGLTDDDIRRIITDANSCPLADSDALLISENISLSLISLLYRYGFLAKALKFSVKDLITLKTISGIDPFHSLELDPIGTLDLDHPYSRTIRFVRIASTIKDGGFKVEDLDYLLRHRFDPLGKYRIESASFPAFLGKMSAGLRNIGAELSRWASSPPTDDQLREKLALLLPLEDAAKLAGMLAGTYQFESHIIREIENAGDLITLIKASDIRVDYDPVSLGWRLLNNGFLTDTRKAEILGKFDIESVAYNLLSDLMDLLQSNAGKDFAKALRGLVETLEFSGVMNIDPEYALTAGDFKNFPVRLSYDVENRLQHVTYKGLLGNELDGRINADLLDALKAAGRAVFDPLFKACIGEVFSTLELTVENAGEALSDAAVALLEKEAAITGLMYDEAGHVQHLTYQGLVVDIDKDRIIRALQAQIDASHPEDAVLEADVDTVGVLLAAAQSLQSDYLKRCFQPDFLTTTEFTELFDGNGNGEIDAADLSQIPSPQEKSRLAVAASLLPFLKNRLKAQFIIDAFVSDTGEDPAIVRDILSEPTLLADPATVRAVSQEEPGTAQAHRDPPLFEAISEAEKKGADAEFLDADGNPITLSGAEPIAMPAIDSEALDENGQPFRPPESAAMRCEGWFKVATNGFYRFFIGRDTAGENAARAVLNVRDLSSPLVQLNAENRTEASALVELRGGEAYRFTFEASGLLEDGETEHNARLEIAGESLSRRNLGSLEVFPASAVEHVQTVRVLAKKTLQILRTLQFSERQTLYILNNRNLFDDFDFGMLAVRDAQAELEKTANDDPGYDWLLKESGWPTKLFKKLLRLIDLSALKRELSPDSDDLVAVMENSKRTYLKAENPDWADAEKVKIFHFGPISALTRREVKIVRETATQLGFRFPESPTSVLDDQGWWYETPDFSSEKGIRRLWEALQVLEKFGLSATDLGKATNIVNLDAAGFTIASDLRNAVKARYGTEDWQGVVKGISDVLRGEKRDALVAGIMAMHPETFTMKEKLLEYFLVDPEMEPVVKTSRIRMALESVRRFIQRCLDGKEFWVRPAAIDKERWKVMGRFRFWQANRRIFLHPENWLEPEFRDDKSHLFRELEGTLLQGDVTDELAEDAFFKYLAGLEQIARLEVMTVYLEPIDDPNSGWLHVIARTHTPPYKYFYRRYESSEWTPWEPIDLEIEGDNVVAIVWKQKLHIFWVTLMEKPDDAGAQTTGESVEDMAKKKDLKLIEKKIEAQLNWSDYFQGEWRARQASKFITVKINDKVGKLNGDNTVIYAKKEQENGIEGGVRIHFGISYQSIIDVPYSVQGNMIPAQWIETGYSLSEIRDSLNAGSNVVFNGYTIINYQYVNDDWSLVLLVDIGWCYIIPWFGSSYSLVFIPQHPEIIRLTYKSLSSFETKYYVAFRFLNKNCPPEITQGGLEPRSTYFFESWIFRKGARFWGRGALYQLLLKYPLLGKGHKPPDSALEFPISLAIPDYPYNGAEEQTVVGKLESKKMTIRNEMTISPSVQAVMKEKYLWSLGAPFFYQDGLNVFFVEPTLTRRLSEVDEWAKSASEDGKPQIQGFQGLFMVTER